MTVQCPNNFTYTHTENLPRWIQTADWEATTDPATLAGSYSEVPYEGDPQSWSWDLTLESAAP